MGAVAQGATGAHLLRPSPGASGGHVASAKPSRCALPSLKTVGWVDPMIPLRHGAGRLARRGCLRPTPRPSVRSAPLCGARNCYGGWWVG
eukprot:3456874-Pleurochrysis_carterae.AAC.3